ncbi:hypothetical protein GFS60_06771 (plasmid) [Rhodococcus sp. WAY2]|nr:hypothetical protein GFS60_06771 [Rhodococcus sp. WAY2]
MKYEEAADRCPSNHLLISGRCLVGWEVCGCPAAAAKNSGHRTFFCRN